MEILRIQGGQRLEGKVQVSGSKNAALPQFAAALLSGEETILENVPDLSDVRFMGEILAHLGADIERLGQNAWKIHPANIHPDAPYELVRKMRASICLLGPLVARLKRAKIPMPGGCVIGHRPIDLHLRALNDNAIMASVLTQGTTVLDGAACEPEILDLCTMLEKMGAKISGAGSHLLKIEGVEKLQGCTHRVIPDRIEAATYIMAGAITRGEVCVQGIQPSHLGAFAKVMKESGIQLQELGKDTIEVKTDPSGLKPFEVITLPHPGFPTDLQAQACALACTIPGLSILTERVYPSRFMHIPELLRMGAEVSLEGANAIVRGGKTLNGAPVMASDLRASAALILAGLVAEGETWVHRIYHLDRGYELLDKKLRNLGARIERLPESALPPAFRSPVD